MGGNQAWVSDDPCGRRLRRQSTSAACPAASQHFSTVFSGHAGTKAMVTLTLQDAWLKCTLHDVVLFTGAVDVDAAVRQSLR